MEFWGAEVKTGEPLKVEAVDDMILHLSQASLGEVKKDKGNESIILYVKVGGQKLVLGTLSADKCTHISYDLVFEKEFELSHNWKNGSVFFCGYRATTQDEESGPEDAFDSDSDSESEEEGISVITKENGKPDPKAEQTKASADKAKAVKPDSSATKSKVKIAEPIKDDDDDSDDDSDDEDDDSDEDESGDEVMPDAEDGSDDEDDEESDDEDVVTPKKAVPNKKRPAESATKTPAPEKKAKLVTPQKTGADGKKGSSHTATPHPSKKAGKTNDKSKQQTPNSSEKVTCKSCSKTFNSDGALQSHTKAKHSDAK